MELNQVSHAGFGPRFLAFGIDLIIFIIGISILSSFLNLFGLRLVPDFSGLTFQEIMNSYYDDPGNLQAYNMTLIALNILYFSYFESSEKRATPGKQFLNLQVVNVNGNGLTLGEAFMRNAGKIVSQLLLYIGFFMCLFTKDKQCLHDIFAKSYVIKND